MEHCDNCGQLLDPARVIYTDNLPQRVAVCGLPCHLLTALKFRPKRTHCSEDVDAQFRQSLLCYEKFDDLEV